MVKFSSGSHVIGPIANKLRDIIGKDQVDIGQNSECLVTHKLQTIPTLIENNVTNNKDPSQDLDFWDLDGK